MAGNPAHQPPRAARSKRSDSGMRYTPRMAKALSVTKRIAERALTMARCFNSMSLAGMVAGGEMRVKQKVERHKMRCKIRDTIQPLKIKLQNGRKKKEKKINDATLVDV